MDDVKFLFDNQLIASLENLIKNAKHKLLLVSPFIDLDRRIQDALKEKLTKHDFQLLVLFGKNEDNLYRSIKKDSLEFLKQFPNVEIRYNDRLHAKFYLNDFDFIMTSLNLYDYSLAKNIEVGITYNYATKGLIGKVLNSTDTVLSQGVDKVKQDVLGMDKEINPIEAFQSIYDNSELKYKTEPIIVDKDGVRGLIGGKKLNGFNVIKDELSLTSNKPVAPKTENTPASVVTAPIQKETIASTISSKCVSASQLSKTLGVSQSDIINLMQKSQLINGDKITEKGELKGLVMKNYMGKDYIAYPENLEELGVLKKNNQ